MKKIILILFVVLASCTKMELGIASVPYGRFEDSWVDEKGRIIVSTCEISPFMEDEELILVEVSNVVYSFETKTTDRLFEVRYSTSVLPLEFQREIRNLKKQKRTCNPIQFVAKAKGVEITWWMFDRICEEYESY